MTVSKGLGTYAGLVAAFAQYLGSVALFLEADDPLSGLGPLATATATLLAVIVGRMSQAKAAIENPPKPVGWNAHLSDAVSGQIGGKVGLGINAPSTTTATYGTTYAPTSTTGTSSAPQPIRASPMQGETFTTPRPGAEIELGQPTDLSREVPGGSVPPPEPRDPTNPNN